MTSPRDASPSGISKRHVSTPRLILASSSPRRLALLRDIGLTPHDVIAADIDETPHPRELPQKLAARLAAEKLTAVALRYPDAVVVAADTVVGVGRRILPKAESADDVRHCLALMSGRRHHVYTGVAVRGLDGKIRARLVESCVIFNHLSEADIEKYIASEEGLGKAGGYAIQGKAAALIRFMSGSYSNIVGLPLFETAALLRASGLGGLL